tara:strand:+ start:251 stop:628 length:378 start_codon:yes stop_codon:yes gene_type:complete
MKKIEITFYSFTFTLLIALSLFLTHSVSASPVNNNKLLERISKDYTNKFCNSLAFGLSKDSAMTFSKKENDLIFKTKKGRDDLNEELIANNIAISVVENCGYLVNLSGEEGISEFTKNYISMNNN